VGTVEIGLFPLALVLLPGEQIPLHIFEPRYRELIVECLEQEAPFGLVFADDDGVREIGTHASVVEVLQRYDDGRLDIVVEGGERFRLLRLTDGRSFHTGEIELVEDVASVNEAGAVERAAALYGKLLDLTGADIPAPEPDDPQLSFSLAGRFELASELKLELLAETSEAARLERVCEILETALAEIERRRVVAERARGNGHAPAADAS
jgi:ATP-dependent Lon protease